MKIKQVIQFPIFESRWVLLIFYYGLIAAQLMYAVKFLQTFCGILLHFWDATYSDLLLSVLELVDMVLVGNLIKMVISGSYQSFIEKLDNDHAEKVTSGALKVKMATSLVMVSGINLLQPFFSFVSGNSTVTTREIVIKCIIHLVFLTSAIGIAYIEYMHEKSKMFDKVNEETCIKKLF